MITSFDLIDSMLGGGSRLHSRLAHFNLGWFVPAKTHYVFEGACNASGHTRHALSNVWLAETCFGRHHWGLLKEVLRGSSADCWLGVVVRHPFSEFLSVEVILVLRNRISSSWIIRCPSIYSSTHVVIPTNQWSIYEFCAYSWVNPGLPPPPMYCWV